MFNTVLVMGGSYFIGKRIVEVLSQHNYDVTVLNRGSNKINLDSVKEIICDRYDKSAMQNALFDKNYDYIIDVSGVDKISAEILCQSLNLVNTKKFIFISSSAVYKVQDLQIPYKETDTLGESPFWGDYGTNKIDAENYYIDTFKNLDIPLIILRPPYMYGENNYVQRESFIFDHILNDKPIIIPKSNPYLQFTYTTDLANNIIDLIGSETQELSIYNVGNKKGITCKNWVEACATAMGKQAKIIFYDNRKHGKNSKDFFPFLEYDDVLDTKKIRRVSSRETNFIQGLKNAYNWFLKEKENIVFKELVAKNETEILKSLNKNEE